MIEFTDELEKRVWAAAFELSSVYYVNISKKYASDDNHTKAAIYSADNVVMEFRKQEKKKQ